MLFFSVKFCTQCHSEQAEPSQKEDMNEIKKRKKSNRAVPTRTIFVFCAELVMTDRCMLFTLLCLIFWAFFCSFLVFRAQRTPLL